MYGGRERELERRGELGRRRRRRKGELGKRRSRVGGKKGRRRKSRSTHLHINIDPTHEATSCPK